MKITPFMSIFAVAILFVSIAMLSPLVFGAGFLGAAIFTPSTNVGEIRKSAGGTTYSKGHYGNFFKNKTAPTNPNTDYQIDVRNALRLLSKAFSVLSDNAINAWNALGAQMNRTNSLGQSYTLTGINVYNELNGNLLNAGEAKIDVAPNKRLDNVPAIDNFRIDAVATPGTEDVTANFDSFIAADQKMIIESTGIISNGIRYFKNFKQFVILDTSDLTGTSIKAAMITRFGKIPAAGEKAVFRAKLINTTTGFSGPVSQSIAIGTI